MDLRSKTARKDMSHIVIRIFLGTQSIQLLLMCISLIICRDLLPQIERSQAFRKYLKAASSGKETEGRRLEQLTNSVDNKFQKS